MITTRLVGNGKFVIDNIMTKDGHTDAASALTSCKTIISHCEMIMSNLEDPEASLPTWWTNKLAISEYEVVSAANYLAAGSMEP